MASTMTQRRSPRISSAPSLSAIANWVAALEVLLGVGALIGGGQFILAPDGHIIGMPLHQLAGTPFDSFLVPGILLFTFVGVVPVAAAAATLRHRAVAPLAAVAVGVILMVWITVEMLMLAGPASLFWVFYLVLGTVIVALGLSWRYFSHTA